MELISGTIDLRDLSLREFKRIEPTIRIIKRDRMIRAAFRDEMKRVTRDEAIENVAQCVWDGQILSERQIWRIVYGA